MEIMTVPTNEDQLLLREYLQAKNATSLRFGALLGLVLVPLFWISDWAVIRDYVWLTAPFRVLASLWSLAIIYCYSHFRATMERHVTVLTMTYSFYIGSIIVLMCWLHEGLASQYYAGLSLVVVAIGFIFTWPFRISLIFFGSLYSFYVLPSVFVGQNSAPRQASINQLFLVSMIAVTVFSQRHRYWLEVSNFYSSLDLKRAKTKLEHAIGRLEDLDRQKTQFFSNITHELRTPLTIILSQLESILDGDTWALDSKQRELLQPMWSNAIRLLKLINDLLEISKINDGFLRLKLEQSDLHDMLDEIVSHTRPLAARKNIEVNLDLRSRSTDLHVDLEKIERVVINLLSNALKFTEAGGRVDVVLETLNGETCITVADTGIGIPADRLEMIFERFSQADGSVTRRFGGTGIGLAFARDLVEMHGGRIDLQSEVGVGSRFTVHLLHGTEHFQQDLLERRTHEERSATAGRRGEDREPREWTRQLLERDDYRFLDISLATERRVVDRVDNGPKATKVLVVEDNVDVLRLISAQLSVEHSVFLAQDGLQGLEMARRERPDVIVTDYMMPRLDGVGLIKELRADPDTADTPIIMVTARGDLDDRLHARGAGADIHLTKPFSPRELRAAVAQLLKKRGIQVSSILRANVRSLEVISAGLAHQIHNPLNYIKSALFVIDQQHRKIRAVVEDPALGTEERLEVMDRAQVRIEQMRQTAERGVERLKQVTELVRRYAREGYPVETTPLLLDQAVRDVARLVAPSRNTDVHLKLDLDAEGCQVDCIPEELQQAIRNLLQNALDAVSEGGHVELRTRREG